MKQAEILGQIRTEFGLPEEQEFNLADLSTIAAIITLVERHHSATDSVAETKAIEEMRRLKRTTRVRSRFEYMA